MAKRKYIYKGVLDRFGYDLTVIAFTEEECKEKLMEEYVSAFKVREPECNPKEDIAYDRYSERTYYDQALEDIEISEYELGKVEWQ